MKKISIITPSFNQGEFLEETIDSVLSQHYPNLEYMIIDGGSTDNSVEIIKKHEKHLSWWVSEKDSGQSEAVNKGLNRASGEIIGWLNSDDCYTPGTLNKVSGYFENNKTLVVSGKGNVLQDGQLKSVNPGADIYPLFEKTVGWARIDQPETFFRATAIHEMGNLNTHLHYVMDREWWIRFLLKFGQEHVAKVEDLFVNFRLHGSSKTFNYQSLFEQEANNVYYSLAKQNDLKEASIFEDSFDVQNIPSLPYKNIAGHAQLQKIIHYFWLFQARLSYAANQPALTKKYLDMIDKQLLESDDAKEYSLLKTRAAFVPVWLKKLLNKRGEL